MMRILWQLKKATVHEVLDALPVSRKLAYTSVSTIIRILEQKGYVGSEKLGRGHLYFPLLKKEEYERRAISSMVDQLFEGAPLDLIRCLIRTEKLGKDELHEIQKILEENR